MEKNMQSKILLTQNQNLHVHIHGERESHRLTYV
jgi:hypothetical protein